MIEINHQHFPILRYIKEGLNNQLLGFNSQEFANTFLKQADYYSAEFSELSLGFVRDGRRINLLTEGLTYFIDYTVSEDLWNNRNNIDSGTGLLMLESEVCCFYSFDNNQKNRIVSWRVFTFAGDIFLNFSTGNWKYDDLTSKKTWIDHRSIDCESHRNGYVLHIPIRMVNDYLMYTKSLPDGAGHSTIKPSNSYVLGDLEIKNGTELDIECYSL